ncbi:hypothetical protein [Paenibacillus pini]|uniref:Uncharacterized protein n=1 Tax=Paenibacillus pini JCM 16418 TaxID=1236976 RepID=W7Z8K4_9BACL|nr:hypothetical protein [Paenibacillus pini]GAF10769.1 hypothetical protein JCM16418_4989 [Paenibacillus pini JCM 16418]
MEQIISAISVVRLRLQLLRVGTITLIGLAAGMASATLWLVITRIFPIGMR